MTVKDPQLILYEEFVNIIVDIMLKFINDKKNPAFDFREAICACIEATRYSILNYQGISKQHICKSHRWELLEHCIDSLISAREEAIFVKDKCDHES